MKLNLLLILIIGVSLILLLSGCVPSQPEEPEEPQEPKTSPPDQEILADLMSSLNSSVSSYSGTFKRDYVLGTWAGHSGSTNHQEDDEIFIEVSDDEIINYTREHNKETSYLSGIRFFEYYDPSKKRICSAEVKAYSRCKLSELPIMPEIGGWLRGCQIKRNGGYYSCMCGTKNVSIEVGEDINPWFPCVEDFYTEGFELWDEFNIIYYPETNKSFCYFVTKGHKNPFAFPCVNEHIRLIPTIETEEPLKNVVCRYSKYNQLCSCSFDPIRMSEECRDEIPENFDLVIKKEISNDLPQISFILSGLSKETNAKYGTCYYFFDRNLNQTFCFDEQDLLTYAKWGWNTFHQRSSYRHITTIEKID